MEITENQRIKILRDKKGLSQGQLADLVGVKQNAISMVERGKNNVSLQLKRSLNAILNVNLNWLETGEGNIFIEKSNNDNAEIDITTKEINEGAPYYPDINASAGLNFLIDNGDNHPESYIKVPGLNVDAFINVFGDSMYPKYQSGQVIGVKQIEKDMVHFGYAYVVEMIDGESYIKYIQPGKDDDHWSLESENNHYKPKPFHLSKIRRVFKIKSVLTKESL